MAVSGTKARAGRSRAYALGRRLSGGAADGEWTRHRHRRPLESLDTVTELEGLAAVWTGAMAGSIGICFAGGVHSLVLLALALGACCLCRRRRVQHAYAAVPGEDFDIESRADQIMAACCVREMQSDVGSAGRSR